MPSIHVRSWRRDYLYPMRAERRTPWFVVRIHVTNHVISVNYIFTTMHCGQPQNYLTYVKRSKVQRKIFVEEYISASFLLRCSMWLQLFLSLQQEHVYIQICKLKIREVRDQNLAESLYCVLRKNTLLYKCLFSLRSFNGYRQLSVKLIKCWGGGGWPCNGLVFRLGESDNDPCRVMLLELG